MRTIHYFCVRQVGTRLYFPEPRGRRRGRGGSFTEPVAGQRPRLFSSEQAARSFIGQWRRGEVHVQGGSGNHFDDNGEVIIVKPVAGRNTLDLEIVRATLRIGS